MGQYTGSNPNVAFGKTLLATDSITGYEPGMAVDSSLVTYCAIPGDAPAWLQINLGGYYYIDGYGMILPNAGELPGQFIFQVSEDGSDWTDLGTQTIASSGTYSYDVISPDPIRYVRFYITAKDALASFSEIYVFGYPETPPDPPVAQPATNITTNGFTAHWNASDRADGYVISVATDFGFTNLLPGYDKWAAGYRSWNVTDLDPGTTYYYRVRAYNVAGTSVFGNKITVTTEKAEQTISFSDLETRTYGDSGFELTATTSSGLPVSYNSSNETVATINGSTVTIHGTGTTSITASQEGNEQYFAAVPVIQDLVVNRKTLTVSGATAEDKVYDGTTDAIISGANLNGVVGDDDVTLMDAETGLFAQADVGTGIAVTASMSIAGADTANYSFNGPGELTADIIKAPLVVTADNKSREECASNPDFTVRYTGFVGGEDASVMDSEPVASCTADENSPDGEYGITVAGGSAANYFMTYISGKLTVTPDVTPPVLVVQNITVQLDESDQATIAAEDLVSDASDNCGIASTTLSQYAFDASDIGEVNVDVTVTDDAGNSITETAVVTVLGQTGLKERENLKTSFYPNPTDGLLRYEFDGFADELKVMDLTGKTVIRKTDLDTQGTLDLSEYHTGIYIIQVIFGDESYYCRVVKK